MKKGIVFMPICLFIVVSCKQPDSNQKQGITSKFPYFLNIEAGLNRPETFQLSKIGQEIEYIPLETTPNNLMRNTGRIIFTEDFIFVDASAKVFQFDRNGKYIGEYGRSGRGPGEYTYFADFCVDPINKKVFILGADFSHYKVLEYNYGGEYIRTKSLDWETSQILFNSSIGFVFNNSDDISLTDRSKWNICFTDSEYTPYLKISRYSTRGSNLDGANFPMYFYNGVLHYKQYAVDTSYIFKDNKPEPYAIINLGKRKMDPNIMFPVSNQDISEMIEKIDNKIEIREISENEEYLFVRMALGLSDSSFYYVFSKQTLRSLILDNNGFENDLDGGKPFWPKYIYDDEGIVVDYCEAFEFLNYMRDINPKESRDKYGERYDRLEKIVNDLDEMSNPVLIIIRPYYK